jgi:2-polyprenyl-3-methyl-5-hydroxy-6-metoxy-1,4-benzoquinol methylase
MKFYAQSQLAAESNDHLYPVGCVNDNYNSPNLREDIEKHYLRKISFLDLGCAGGEFVMEFMRNGHVAYGLEGSSHCLQGVGQNNWLEYHNKNLFLCDLTKEYHFKNDVKPFLFDCIHSSEVIEHIKPDDLEKFFIYVQKNMKPDGIFCCQINVTPDVRNVDGKEVVMHHSLFSHLEWKVKLINYGFLPCEKGLTNSNHFGYLFQHKFRDHGDSSLYCCLTKDNGNS